MTALVVSLFAGPGGWDLGARTTGLDPVGIELDPVVCATRAAAGLQTIRADVATMPVEHLAGRVWGLLGSPPCQAFSAAGKGAGRRDLPLIHQALEVLADGGDPLLKVNVRSIEDLRSLLVLEPLRWVRDVRPWWVALEQVPPVLPLWRRYAEVFQGWGYSTWTGLLNSADYGVVSACPLHATNWPTDPADSADHLSRCATALATAERLATTRPDEAWIVPALSAAVRLVRETRAACAAAATCDGRARHLAASLEREAPTTRGGAAAELWTSEATSISAWTADTAVSIASSLSSFLGDLWDNGRSSTTSTETRRTTIRRTLRCIAATLTTGPGTGPASREAGCGLCVDVATPQTRERAILMASLDHRRVHPPTPTHSDQRRGGSLLGLKPWVSMAQALGWPDGVLRSVHEPARTAPTLSFGHAAASWAFTRPATTVQGDPRVGRPGHKYREDGERQYERDAVRITVEQAAVLQGMPPDHPFAGTKTQRFQQVGDLVPPPLAAAVIAALTGGAR